MNGWQILAFLILSSSLPALVVFFWFRIARYQFSVIKFLFALLAGAAAYFPALIMQNFFPRDFFMSGKLGLIAQIFLPVALTEEFSRLIVLLVFFFTAGRIEAWRYAKEISASNAAEGSAAPVVQSLTTYSAVIYGSAAGLIAGFGFAILENAAYGASNAGFVLLRLFTAAPIHGACGARVGSAAILFRTRPVQGLSRFLTAVLIHGIYNSMVVMPGIAPIAAVLIALFSLASSVLSIRSGMNKKRTNAKQAD